MDGGKYCLVLSGGGAKGVYHIGVWRALRELGIEIEAVVGNSIGAIIAAFVAQDAHEALEDIGSLIGLDYILDVPEELMENGELKITPSKWDAFLKFYRKVVSKKGLDTSPLRALLASNIDEAEIRSRGLDFGLVTYNLSDLKPREVFVEEMEAGELISYVMASSAVPGFESPEISGKKYIDGGVFDNIPFAMARSRGYTNLIIVDISGAGINRKPDIVGTRTVYIKNSINMGGLLDFDREFMDDYTLLGYLDTLKVFGKLRGMDYFIEPDGDMERRFDEFLETDPARAALSALPASRREEKNGPLSTGEAVRRILPKKRRHDRWRLAIFADCAAMVLAVDRVRKWTYRELFDALAGQETSVRAEAREIERGGGKAFVSQLRMELKDKQLLKTPYIYHLIGDRFLPDGLKESLEKYIIARHPELAAGVFFLEILGTFRDYLESFESHT
jgi:NTE family protein